MTDIVIRHDALGEKVLRLMIMADEMPYGGKYRLGILGWLDCASNKRMKGSTHLFFAGEHAAYIAGFRLCGHRRQDTYRIWSRAASGVRA